MIEYRIVSIRHSKFFVLVFFCMKPEQCHYPDRIGTEKNKQKKTHRHTHTLKHIVLKLWNVIVK